MNKLITFIVCLMIISCGNNEKKLEYFKCENKFAPESCINCTREKDIYLSFIADKQNSRVMERMFTSDVNGISTIYDNCKIFNNENWDCSSVSIFPNSTVTDSKKMTNGIFSSTRSIIGNELFEERSWYGFCAK
jgi:hypothetical protein